MTRLPRPTARLDRNYIESLVSSLERELQNKASRQGGHIYISNEQPLVLIAPDGRQYRIGVDGTGSLTTTEIS